MKRIALLIGGTQQNKKAEALLFDVPADNVAILIFDTPMQMNELESHRRLVDVPGVLHDSEVMDLLCLKAINPPTMKKMVGD
jgi:hypothetical protein